MDNIQQHDHVILLDEKGGYFIISAHPCKQSVFFVLAIDQLSGSIVSHGTPGYDLFPTQQQALNSFELNHSKIVKKIYCKALLGFVAFEGGVSYLLVATKTRGDTILPFGHVIHTVLEHEWVCSSNGWVNGVLDQGAQQKLAALQAYPLAGTHFYCCSFDISRPYPSVFPVDDPDTQVIWNGWMRGAFARVGLGVLCVPLLQGMAFSAPLPISPSPLDPEPEKSFGHACFILRRNHMNGGTKHFAGGMNEHGVPGNESELEILLWTFKHPELQQPPRRHQNKANDIPDLSRASNVPSNPLDQYTESHTPKNLDKNRRNTLYRSSDELDPELAQLDLRKNGVHALSEEHGTASLQQPDGEVHFTPSSSYESKDDNVEIPYNNSSPDDEHRAAHGSRGMNGSRGTSDGTDDASGADGSHKDASTKHVRWAGYVWRRGMVPLWWQILPQSNAGSAGNSHAEPPPGGMAAGTNNLAQTNNIPPPTGANGGSGGIAQANIGLDPESGSGSTNNFFSANSSYTATLTGAVHHNPFRQCATYYQRVLRHYESLAHLLLLRPAALDYQEAALNDLLGESLKHVLKTFGKPISILEFDWVTSLRTNGLHHSVEAIWNKTKEVVKDFGYSYGSDACGKAITQRQTGIMRVACADSVDRTHMVIFVLTLPILAELAKRVALLPDESELSYFEQSLDSVTRTLKNIGLLEIGTTVFLHMAEVGSMLFANQLSGASLFFSGFSRGYDCLSRPLLVDLDQRLLAQRAYLLTNNETKRNMHYQLFLGHDAPQTSLVIVSHNSLVLTSSSLPPVRNSGTFPALSRVYTMVLILPRPAYVCEVIVRGAGGCKMSVSLGNYVDPQTHTLSLHGVLIPHASTPLVYALPASPFKTYGSEFLLPYSHRPTRVVRLTFTYNWQSPVDSENSKPNINGVADRASPTKPISPKTAFNFNFTNFGTNNDISPKDANKDASPHTSSSSSSHFAKPYVGVLGHWVGVSDLSSSPGLHSPDTTSQEFGDDTDRIVGSSISRLSEDSMHNLCVSKTVDDIITLLENSSTTEQLLQQSPNQLRNTSPLQTRQQSPSQSPILAHTQKIFSQSTQMRIPAMAGSDVNDGSQDTTKLANGLLNFGYPTNASFTIPPNHSTVATAAAAAASAVTNAVSSFTTSVGAKRGKEGFSNVEKYRAMVESQRPLGFTHALELECFRIQLALDERTRDCILAELGCTLELYNPSHYQFHRDEKTETAIRKARPKTANCQVGSQNCTGSLAIFGRKQCAYCGKRSCTNCIAGTAERVVEYKWDKPTHVCVFCASEISRQTHFLALLKAHSEIKGSALSVPVPSNNEAWFQMIAAACAKVPHVSRTYYPSKPDAQKNCAEFPHACIAKEVPTDALSPPIESVLFSHAHAPLTLFWQAPPNVASVNIIIALPFLSLVRELVLLVDAKGYTPQDAPVLSVCVGNTLESVESCLALNSNDVKQADAPELAYRVGEWAVDMEGYPPCSTLIFTFPEPRACQIVAIKFSLPPNIPDITSIAPPQGTNRPSSLPSSSRTPSPPSVPSSSSFSSLSHPSVSLHNPTKVSPREAQQHPISYVTSSVLPMHSSLSSSSDRYLTTLQLDDKPHKLHIGRIRIHGSFPITTPSPSFPLSMYRTTFPSSSLPSATPTRSPAAISRNPSFRSTPPTASPLSPLYPPPPEGWKPVAPTGDIARGRTLELTMVVGVRLMGIGLTVQHGVEAVASQVRSIRVSGLSTNSKSEICAFHNLCRILVPKTSPNSTLYFHIPTPPLNVIMFEFLSTYGSNDAAPCTINLFS